MEHASCFIPSRHMYESEFCRKKYWKIIYFMPLCICKNLLLFIMQEFLMISQKKEIEAKNMGINFIIIIIHWIEWTTNNNLFLCLHWIWKYRQQFVFFSSSFSCPYFPLLIISRWKLDKTILTCTILSCKSKYIIVNHYIFVNT